MSSQPPKGIGFIGLGSQGGPMAHRIVDAGMPLVVWARRPEVLAAYTDKGAVAAATVAELGAQCRHVGVCVVNDADVLGICDQLIPAMPAGGVIAIHSTVLPETVVELERRCAEAGLQLVDAPVSGGEPAARAGVLTVMCGGEAGAFAAARPVFDTFGKMVVLLGAAGAGQRAKIVNNALLSAHIGIAWSALGAAAQLDIDKAALAELIKESSGRSFGFEVAARLPAPQAFEHGARLLHKDIELLKTILPGDPGVTALWNAGGEFLLAATGADNKE
ncbi:MAG: NAD(P)-dependent oxidoreductase [Sphingomonadales bacterium]|nr:NAD(P)-dependent oxidoreductase [Sphingomonadales bacterium]